MFADLLLPPNLRPAAGDAPAASRPAGGTPRVFVTAVALAAPPAAVFRLLADVEALPHWAPDFCERLELDRRGWSTLTVWGDGFCALEADARAGTVDLRFGEQPERLDLLVPLRVLALPAGDTLVTLTLLRPSGQSDAGFRRLHEAWVTVLRRLSVLLGAAGDQNDQLSSRCGRAESGSADAPPAAHRGRDGRRF